MKNLIFFILILIVLCLISPVSGEQSEEEKIFGEVQNISVTVPPTSSAVLGSQESMTEYSGWLNNCVDAIMSLTDQTLKVFGMKGLGWSTSSIQFRSGQSEPAGVTTPVAQAQTVTNTAIRSDADLMTVGTITGSGHQTASVAIPEGYWELWYTADPLITGGQNSHSSKGSNSAVFPSMSIMIYDESTGEEIDEVEPPGGLDAALWARSGDPRPWTKKYYRGGGKTLAFDVSARHVKSYTIEIRVKDS